MTAPTATRCHVLVGGFGSPSQRDLDVGRHLVTYLEPLEWPDDVVVEDLSFSAHLVLHRVQELCPRKLVLLGAVATGTDPPGSVRRRHVAHAPGEPHRAHEELAASLGGALDIGHTISVLRNWGGLPPETVVIEVEPADCSFGVGFSEEIAGAFDTILAMVREEIARDGGTVEPSLPAEAPAVATSPSRPDGIGALMDYADRRKRARLEDRHRGGLLHERLADGCGIEIAARSRPWGMGLNGGGDWYDVLPLGEGWVGAVIGDAPGRGMEAVALKADLRAATQAYAVLCGPSPGEIVRLLDRFVAVTGRGTDTTMAVVALHPATGELRLCSAGHCPPLVLDSRGPWFVHEEFTAALGVECERRELSTRLEGRSTVLLFTDGLVERRDQPLALGLMHVLETTTACSGEPETLCDVVLDACLDRHRREDDVSLLALRVA